MFLAHLRRRLIGELIVYRGIRRSSDCRPSVNIFKRHLLLNREADSFHIPHIAFIGRANEKLCFYSGRIRTLVAMATYSSHILIMGKVEICNFFSVSMEILGIFFYRNDY